jgi:hypothetical protein
MNITAAMSAWRYDKRHLFTCQPQLNSSPQRMTDRPPMLISSAPRRALWVLAALVSLMHWWVLADGPLDLGLNNTTPTRPPANLVFNTRRIEVPPPAASKPAAGVIQAARLRVKPPAASPSPAQAPSILAAAPVLPEPAAAPLPVAPVEASPGQTDAQPLAQAPSIQAEPPPVVAAAQPEPTQSPSALSIPNSVRLSYKMTGLSRGLNYHANGELNWLREANRYESSMVVSAFLLGSRSMTSVGEVTADGLAPKRFGDKARNELAAHFDAEKGKITFSANRPELPWQRGAQDRLSVFFQLAGLLGGQADGVPTGTRIAIYTVGPRDAETWTFIVENMENLSLPMGEIKALRVTREPKREFDQKIETWFAPSMSYWPVRIKITQSNGDFVDQQLSGSSAP